MELERCVKCDEPTEKAGENDDSLYRDDGSGPFCEECFDERSNPMNRDKVREKFIKIIKRRVLEYAPNCASDVLAKDLLAVLDLPEHAVGDEVWLNSQRMSTRGVPVQGRIHECLIGKNKNTYIVADCGDDWHYCRDESELYSTRAEAEKARKK